MVVPFEIECAGGTVRFRGKQFELRNGNTGRITNTAVLETPAGLNRDGASNPGCGYFRVMITFLLNC